MIDNEEWLKIGNDRQWKVKEHGKWQIIDDDKQWQMTDNS